MEEPTLEPETNGEVGENEENTGENTEENVQTAICIETNTDSPSEPMILSEPNSDPVVSEPEAEEQEEHDDMEMEISPDLGDIEVEPCRLCDDVCEKMFNIFEDNPEGYQLIGLIKENLPIVLYKTDPLSKQVCEKCVLNLQIISSLKKRSRKTQEKYVEKLKTEGDTTDKNVLLFLGCTGSKLIDNGEEEEEEEEELKDEATSTEDLTILCANCKTAILDASTVNGDVELAGDLHDAIRESLRKNRVVTGDIDSEKVLRRRKIQPLYHELDDSLCSSLTDMPTGGDDNMSQYDDADIPTDEGESEDSNMERPAKRRKLDKSSKEIQDEIDKELAKRQQDNDEGNTDDTDNNDPDVDVDVEVVEKEPSSPETITESVHEGEANDNKREEEETLERERVEQIKNACGEMFKEEPEFTYEPLTLLQSALNCMNTQNVPDFEAVLFEKRPTRCKCKVCGEQFQNVKLLSLHEPTHMDVDIEEKIDNPNPWPVSHPFAKVRNKWLTFFDESGNDEEEDVIVDDENKDVDSTLLVEDTEKTVEMSKKDEVVLVDMKPMVNGMYLGDYTKEERKAFYQCMRIGGQTKRFCSLCRYCFKDNWAIESHYFSFACHYTCRYCGMRFNKQRHRFEEHTKEHTAKKDVLSDKIYTASKVNNTLPKVIQPDKVKRIIPGEPEKPREIRLEDYNTPPVITKGGFDQRNRYSTPGPQSAQSLPMIKIKEEPKDNGTGGYQVKTQNQAYFCRKCYKVFFKLDEFNAHSKNCDYNNCAPTFRAINSQGGSNSPKVPVVKIKQEPGTDKRSNGDVSSAGRPVRNCVRDIGPYKDEVYIPKQILNETLPGPPQSFICHICGTPFPTIYSRNSHMRIHKGEAAGTTNGGGPQMVIQQNILKQRLQQQQQHNLQMQRAAMQQQQMHQQQKQMLRQKQLQQRVQQQQQSNYPQFEEIRVKEEPVDSFEPMVEIHEGHERSPSPLPQFTNPPPSVPREIGGGAVSLTPIVKKPALNPNILKLVENNPNISLVTKKNEQRTPTSTPPQTRSNGEGSRTHGGNIIKNAGGYQGPYAPGNQQREVNGTPTNFVTVSPNLNLSNDDNKSYKCSSCWEAFSNKSHLYFHKKNQCEGSRFPCPFCKKRFGTEAAYSSHIFYSHPE